MSKSTRTDNPSSLQAELRPEPSGPVPGLAAAMLVVVVVRVVIFIAGALANSDSAPPGKPQDFPQLLWTKYDGRSYLHLLQEGYPADRSSEYFPMIAFFPGYPLAARALATFLPPHLALVVLANVCSLIGFVFLYAWVRDLINPKSAMMSVLVMVSSASAVFFCAALTEGPFFMLVAITLWLMQKRRFYLAALVCAAATFTRPTGVALAGTLSLYVLLEGPGRMWRLRLGQALLVGLIASAGAAAYESFLWQRFHDPKIYTQAEGHWENLNNERLEGERQSGEPKRWSFEFLVDRLKKPQAWNYGIAAAALLLSLAGLILPSPVPRVLFLLPLAIFIMTALPNHGLRVSSVVRYESAGLPIFVLLAWWLTRLRNQRIAIAFLAIQLVVQIYYAVLFCRWVWVG